VNPYFPNPEDDLCGHLQRAEQAARRVRRRRLARHFLASMLTTAFPQTAADRDLLVEAAFEVAEQFLRRDEELALQARRTGEFL
jgi:hypothetical protein